MHDRYAPPLRTMTVFPEASIDILASSQAPIDIISPHLALILLVIKELPQMHRTSL